MSNEAIRLPNGEVNSSVHYQKRIALSKTSNSLISMILSELKGNQKAESTILVQVREC